MNLKNINHLFRAYFIENKKMLLICCVVSFAFVTWGYSDGFPPEFSVVTTWLILLFIAGTFFQSSLKRNNSTHFFNLPVTTCERFFYATTLIILLTAIFQAFAIAGAYTGRYLIFPLLRPEASMEFNHTIMGGMELDLAKWWLGWLAALSAFLFGSIYFKKNAFWKTLGIGVACSFVIGLYHLLLLSIAFGKEFYNNYFINLNYEFIGNNVEIVFSIIALFFLSLTYLRLKETEV